MNVFIAFFPASTLLAAADYHRRVELGCRIEKFNSATYASGFHSAICFKFLLGEVAKELK
jgi:hypothetical protein